MDPFSAIRLEVTATAENFHEADYLAANPDVRAAVEAGTCPSGWAHFLAFGVAENRKLRRSSEIDKIRAAKLDRVKPLLRPDLGATWESGKPNFLSNELKKKYDIVETANVGSNQYDGFVVELIESNKSGLVLDAGAGKRNIYYSNVVNYDIVDYDSTDVVGVCEELPFIDDSFEGAISIAVIEHLKDPFRCAAEISRVLKPGGRLVCCAPFLQPLHGYPHHYYNMTHQGLRSLFSQWLEIERQEVIDSIHPVWSLSWILRSWTDGLPPVVKQTFMEMKVGDLIGDPGSLLSQSFARDLPEEKKFELASATLLFARKAE